MRCPKCNGNLISEIWIVEGEGIKDVRCLQCAERFYPSEILMNRQRLAMSMMVDRKTGRGEVKNRIEPYHISCFKKGKNGLIKSKGGI